MKQLIWDLPQWCHNLILKLTGRRLVKVTDVFGWHITYVWSDHYPL